MYNSKLLPPSLTKLWRAVAPRKVRIIPLCMDKYLTVKEPHILFLSWFHQALEQAAHLRPYLACLATVNSAGRPYARIIKIEDLNENGLKFYTSYVSRKASELAFNPNVSIVFHWPQIGRGVRIDGIVKRTTLVESTAQFRRYSRERQLSICARQNGDTLLKRNIIDKAIDQVLFLLNKFEPLPMPPNWGGFHIEPKMYEFCELKDNSSFPRLRFHRGEKVNALNKLFEGANGWSYERCVH